MRTTQTPDLFGHAPRWPPAAEEQLSLQLTLPPRPGPGRRLLADQCNRCHGLHLNPADAELCRQANAQREQF